MLFHRESRLSVVRLWLEWIGNVHGVYNVDNAHQCFNEKPRAIIRPFREENNFYGCVSCGKYHFCYHSYHTCDSIAPTLDINNNMPTCAYSGQTIRNVHNEVIGNYNDVVQFRSDAQHAVTFISSENAMNTTAASSCASKETRRMNTLENMVYSNSTQKKRSPSKKERRSNDKQDMNQYFCRRDTASSRLSSLQGDKKTIGGRDSYLVEESEDYGDMDDNNEEEVGVDEEEDENENDNEEDELKHGKMEVEDEDTVRGVMARNKRLDREVDIDQWMSGEFDCWERDAGGDDIYAGNGDDDDGENEDIMAYDDRLTRMKNPHNNTEFWDDYYSFLLDGGSVIPRIIVNSAVDEDDTSVTSNNNNNNTCSDIEDEECKRKRAYIYDNASNCNNVFKIDPTRWPASLSVVIEDETRRIIDILLRTSMIRDQEVIEKREYARLVSQLTEYYHNIICNIVILVYHSPHIHKLALMKHEKHEKQGKSSYSAKMTVSVTDISSLLESNSGNNGGNNYGQHESNNDNSYGPNNNSEHHLSLNPIDYQRVYDLVCPKKICASLMLQLFTDAFFLSDSASNHIHVWVGDPWLTFMKTEVFNDIIMDYNIIVDPLNHTKKRYLKKSQQYENIFFKKDLTAMSNTIRASLGAYSRYPMWLSNMIYNFKRQ